MKSKLSVLLFALVCIIIVFNEDKPHHNQFSSDACGYYLYLPAIFIYHDLDKLAFYPALDSEYHHSLSVQYSLYTINENKLDKYPVGVALFELLFFLVAHSFCSITNEYKADGFTLPYQLAGIFSNIFWVIVGLFVLRRLLKRYFNDTVTAITLACIMFGANLYAYSAFAIGMSHPYSFFLFSCLLLLTDIVYKKTPTAYTSLLFGLLAGLMCIVRPINIIAMIVPLFWMVSSITSIKDRIRLLGKFLGRILLGLIASLLVLSIQLAYWKYITGHWITYSYQGEGFDFLHPHIIKGLFGYRKGWFVYTPMVLLGFTGFYFLWKKNIGIALPLALFFPVMIYSIFSWRQWWYGGSFGCRPLIESLAFLALPLAAITEHFYYTPGKIKKVLFTTLLSLIIVLNIFQTYQYSMGLLHWSSMTKEYYWRLFGRTEFDRVQNKKYLLKPDGAIEDDN